MYTDDYVEDEIDDHGSELREFFETRFARFAEMKMKNRKRHGPMPSVNTFAEFLHQHPATVGSWMRGARPSIGLQKVVELAIRFWELGEVGNSPFGSQDADELFRVAGHEPVMRISDFRLKEIAYQWNRLDKDSQEDLYRRAYQLLDTQGNHRPAASDGGDAPPDERRTADGNTTDLAETKPPR
jgi:hypothetical protein